jgi:hypothetical protein
LFGKGAGECGGKLHVDHNHTTSTTARLAVLEIRSKACAPHSVRVAGEGAVLALLAKVVPDLSAVSAMVQQEIHTTTTDDRGLTPLEIAHRVAFILHDAKVSGALPTTLDATALPAPQSGADAVAFRHHPL